jgi:hypothetical protein
MRMADNESYVSRRRTMVGTPRRPPDFCEVQKRRIYLREALRARAGSGVAFIVRAALSPVAF